MAETELAVEPRENTGKGVARKLRAAGRIPGVCYGAGAETKPIQLDPRALDQVIHSSAAGINTLIDLKGPEGLGGKLVLVKELQRDPVRGHLLHADLYEVDVKKAIHVSVPIHVSGTPRGVIQEGGILDMVLREIELSCLPRSIPEELRLDVSELDVGDSLHVRDLALPEGVTLLSDGDLSVLSVVAPAAAEEEAAPAEGEEAEGEAAEGAEPKEGEEGEGSEAGSEKDD